MNNKKNKKRERKILINLATLIIILVLIGVLITVKYSPNPNTTEEIAKCIGQHSVLYTQLGCHACEIQEQMFGQNYQYLNVIDCFYDREKCAQEEITATPTWIISGKIHKGVQSIETLQELTHC
jgi:hypothetical protein